MDLPPRNSAYAEFYKPGTVRVPACGLSDEELERRLRALAASESTATGDVVEHIAEFERRRLYAPKRFPTMFEYCTKTLGYSDSAAYLRIYAGRLSNQYPEILDLLRARRLHLTAIKIVGPHLKPSNVRDLLSRSLLKSERELKFLVAEVAPQPERAEVIRHLTPAIAPALPTPVPPPVPIVPPPVSPTSSEPAPDAIAPPAPRSVAQPAPAAPRAKIEPLTPQRVRFAFTASDLFLKKVDRAREILRHKHPAGALEDIFEEIIECFLDVRDPARKARPANPRDTNPRRRSIPIWIKDIVFKRDGGCCAFKSDDGIRCEERGGLEYDHIVPWAKGGASNDPANVRLLCRAHNSLEAERAFGKANLGR